jgi:ferric-dicitrate binding protein FerR (iron transport regulator)
MDSRIDQDDRNAKLRRDDDMLAQLIRTAGRRADPPQEAYDRALAAATHAYHQKIRSRRQRRLVGSIAAGFVIIASAALVLSNLPPAEPVQIASIERIIGTAAVRASAAEDWRAVRAEDESVIGGTMLRTGVSSRAGVVLDGGVSLRLADATEVIVESQSLIRLLSGKVYVDTGAGATGKIELITPAGTARDLGTQFEIRYRDEAYRLRVREGRVLLRRGAEEIDNGAGEQLSIDADGAFARARISRFDADWQWVQAVAPAPDIDGQPLSTLLEWVGRETGRAIHYEPPGLEFVAPNTVLYGNIRHLSPLDALEVMLATTDFEYRVLEDGTIMIRNKVSR